MPPIFCAYGRSERREAAGLLVVEVVPVVVIVRLVLVVRVVVVEVVVVLRGLVLRVRIKLGHGGGLGVLALDG